MRSPLARALLFVVAIAAGCSRSRQAPPSFVLIVADDLRHDALGCAGHPFIQTPNIDRLAAEGALFTSSFAVTPVCCPSRASILTGAYPHLTGASSNQSNIDYAKVPLVSDLLRRRGYVAASIGKWHLGGNVPPRERFDYCLAAGPRGPSTDELTRHAVTFIRENAGKPFFLLVALKNPHLPFHPPERHRRLYADAKIELPASFGDSTAGLQPLHDLARREVERLSKRGDPMREFIREYARMIPSLDEAVGAIDAALGEAGLRERTAIIVTSDNGYLLGEHGLIQKEVAYEPSIRVPLVIRYPRIIPAGRRIDHMVLNVDLAPTILAWAGVEAASNIQGRDLTSLLRDPVSQWRERALFAGPFEPGARPRYLALRTERLKYVRHLSGELNEELFDLAADADERKNLAADSSSAASLGIARRALKEAMTEMKMPAEWSEPIAQERAARRSG